MQGLEENYSVQDELKNFKEFKNEMIQELESLLEFGEKESGDSVQEEGFFSDFSHSNEPLNLLDDIAPLSDLSPEAFLADGKKTFAHTFVTPLQKAKKFLSRIIQ